MADRPTSSPILRFSAAVLKKDLAKARDNLSAVVLRDNRLWLGGDEGTSNRSDDPRPERELR